MKYDGLETSFVQKQEIEKFSIQLNAYDMKKFTYIFILLFAFQSVLMPAAMAASHIGLAGHSGNIALAAGDATAPQDTRSAKPGLTPCCSIDCGCATLLVFANQLFIVPREKTETFPLFVQMAEQPSMVLPHPPRTI